jgi:signal transduction histidine kinase
MPALSFRKRILLALLLLGALPASLAVLGWVVSLRSSNPAVAGRSAIEDIGASGRDLLRALDSTRLTEPELEALREHTGTLNQALGRSQRAEAFSRMKTVGVTVVIVILGTLLIYLAVIMGGNLSRQLSAPIDELIGWTGHIRRHEALPPTERRGGAPEFAALRQALREMAAELRQARGAELEAERLRAFREVARRVAHEMKNPLTPVRFAVRQLAQTATPDQKEALEVLVAESARLEQLAREFATLGRLPEGPSAEVDLGELLAELLRTSLPGTMTSSLEVAPDTPSVLGHYDPLRRAFGNLLRNAVEACQGGEVAGIGAGAGGGGGGGDSCRIDARVSRDGNAVIVALADHGPGIPRDKRRRVFEPYFTDKPDGTGLGLALVKQAIDLHRGTITLSETPGGGATFTVRLPVTDDRGARGERTA